MKQIFLVVVLQLLLVACGQQLQGNASDAQIAVVPAPSSARPGVAKMSADTIQTGAEQSLTELSEPDSAPAGNASNDSVLRKYIALRHNLTVEASAASMQASFDAALQHCEALNCQILSANFNKQTEYNPPSASLSVRLPPRNIDIFLNGLAKHGEVIQHGRSEEDKTNQVMDADARIKNLTELRDRYREMLTEKKAEFKDLIEIEKALSAAQAELDSIISYRKILALETDLVAVDIQFTAAQGITEQGFFAPVARALKNASSIMMESFGSVITFVMSAIPWLLIGIPLLWLIRRYWVKIKAKFM